MNDVKPDKKTDFICHCSGTTVEKIKELVDNGIDDLDNISRLTGACAGCGACETAVLDLLAEYG
ncbi:(2Fe-2S)-binding protein [Methylomicrobium sp. Wu6]|uniref:(2Fe-2S)-binding protein n=1 Tax=Methylomicrobium sp. Wu6 TaxID=3107928 RepID=UPI002DD68E64|nr:(2Fe-2S)-binding protein [Methylomicrobium sp. Wu6]MEC4750483.1 (2Fe-2S)-binding protein [Methylomicrobium sp. Wu6]